ncbi:MAG TPA: DUF5715 family protein [Longimicrobiales bacterium]|nr:DUF5715 family protein [Longimicrobiales bacterium]
MRRTLPVVLNVAVTAALAVALAACGGEAGEAPAGAGQAASNADPGRAAVERVLDTAIARLSQLTDSIDDLLQPVPLLTPSQESALRRFPNSAQLERARSLGARPSDNGELAELRRAGRLMELEDSTELWAVRELDHSVALVTPDAHALLTRIAERFQDRLTEMGLPRYRLEVTSVLRTAESQDELRRTNINAASGTSTHEFGTTLDIAYSSFAAPQAVSLGIDTSDAAWLEPRIGWIAHASLEAAAARKSRELQAILGEVLLDLQQAGDVMVTLERQQPVYHITVARELAG